MGQHTEKTISDGWLARTVRRTYKHLLEEVEVAARRAEARGITHAIHPPISPRGRSGR